MCEYGQICAMGLRRSIMMASRQTPSKGLVGHPSNALAGADDDAESGPFMEPKAGVVLREDRALDGPNASSLGGFDQGLEQHQTDAPSPRLLSDVHGMLGDAGVSASVGHRD